MRVTLALMPEDEIPGDDVPDIGGDTSDRDEYLKATEHVNIEDLFPDREPPA